MKKFVIRRILHNHHDVGGKIAPGQRAVAYTNMVRIPCDAIVRHNEVIKNKIGRDRRIKSILDIDAVRKRDYFPRIACDRNGIGPGCARWNSRVLWPITVLSVCPLPDVERIASRETGKPAACA